MIRCLMSDSPGGIPTVAVHVANQSRKADQFDALNATRKSGSRINTYTAATQP
jgi:hypothetical protein